MSYAQASAIANRIKNIDVQAITVEKFDGAWYVYVQGWSFADRIENPAQVAAVVERAARDN